VRGCVEGPRFPRALILKRTGQTRTDVEQQLSVIRPGSLFGQSRRFQPTPLARNRSAAPLHKEVAPALRTLRIPIPVRRPIRRPPYFTMFRGSHATRSPTLKSFPTAPPDLDFHRHRLATVRTHHRMVQAVIDAHSRPHPTAMPIPSDRNVTRLEATASYLC
jgi:hypothetical protein